MNAMPNDYRKLTPGPTSGLRAAASYQRDWAWRRHVALDFTNQALRTWGVKELVSVCQALLASGHLTPRDPMAGRILVSESSHTPISVVTSPWAEDDAPPSDVKPLLRAAWLRVLVALRGMRRIPQDDRFLNAALYTGRVERVTSRDGAASWEPRLAEGQTLSDWILALFAADAMADREAYDTHLAICDECSFVTFSALDGHLCSDPLQASGSEVVAKRTTIPDMRAVSDKPRK